MGFGADIAERLLDRRLARIGAATGLERARFRCVNGLELALVPDRASFRLLVQRPPPDNMPGVCVDNASPMATNGPFPLGDNLDAFPVAVSGMGALWHLLSWYEQAETAHPISCTVPARTDAPSGEHGSYDVDVHAAAHDHEDLIRELNVLVAQGHHQSALSMLHPRLVDDPKDTDLLRWMAHIRSEQAYPDRAQNMNHRADKLDALSQTARPNSSAEEIDELTYHERLAKTSYAPPHSADPYLDTPVDVSDDIDNDQSDTEKLNADNQHEESAPKGEPACPNTRMTGSRCHSDTNAPDPDTDGSSTYRRPTGTIKWPTEGRYAPGNAHHQSWPLDEYQNEANDPNTVVADLQRDGFEVITTGREAGVDGEHEDHKGADGFWAEDVAGVELLSGTTTDLAQNGSDSPELDFLDECGATADRASADAEPEWLELAPDDEDEAEPLEEPRWAELMPEVDTSQYSLTRLDRARLMANEVARESGEGEQALESALKRVFIVSPWSATKRAMQRSLESGVDATTLEAAVEVRRIWAEHPEFTICFPGLNALGERWQHSEEARQQLGWPMAIRLAGAWGAVPDDAEIEKFLVDIHEHWVRQCHLHGRFPEFRLYVNYRIGGLGEALDILPEWTFEADQELIEHTGHLDEPGAARSLRDMKVWCGIHLR